MVVGCARSSSAYIEIQYPPDAATSACDTITGFFFEHFFLDYRFGCDFFIAEIL